MKVVRFFSVVVGFFAFLATTMAASQEKPASDPLPRAQFPSENIKGNWVCSGPGTFGEDTAAVGVVRLRPIAEETAFGVRHPVRISLEIYTYDSEKNQMRLETVHYQVGFVSARNTQPSTPSDIFTIVDKAPSPELWIELNFKDPGMTVQTPWNNQISGVPYDRSIADLKSWQLRFKEFPPESGGQPEKAPYFQSEQMGCNQM